MERLEIQDTWWTWRGHLQDYYEGYDTPLIYAPDARDPMDRWDYNEMCSFPMRKPNFDVFGAPRRTRSQRGWYHVRQRFDEQRGSQSILDPTLSFSPQNPAAIMRTSGANLPVELVELIGEKVAAVHPNELGLGTMKACALVCRSWARHFLTSILFTASIRSRKQALELQQLECWPGGWLHELDTPGYFISLEPIGLLQLPWVHLVTQVWSVATDDRFLLKLNGPLPLSLKTIRSVHQALPRSAPQSFSRGITRLELNDIHFRRFSDLVHLVCELPDLWLLQCQKVTWGSPVTTSGIRHRQLVPRRECSLRTVFDRDESSSRPQAHISLLIQYVTWTDSSFAPCSHLTVFSVPKRILSHIHTACLLLVGPGSDQLRIPDGQTSEIAAKKPFFSLELDGIFSTRIRTAIRILPNGELVPSRVMHVTIDLRRYYNEGETHDTLNVVDWIAFYNYLMLLDPCYVVFGFPSRDRMIKFATEVVDTVMPHLVTRIATLYALCDDFRWFKVSRDTGAPEGEQDGEYELHKLI